jgi:AmiR/NasT family two-component response regulator
VLGALTLYAPGPGPDQRALLLEAAAGHAALALQSVRQVAHLTSAVGSRDVIGQAKGVLMERYRITADAAFGILAQASQDAHRKLRDVAQQVTETGETPPLRGGPPQR